MKCIVCGKKLPKYKRKYCCYQHAQKGYKQGLSTTKTNTENKVKELFVDFQKAFDFHKERIGSNDSWKLRIFIRACYLLNHTPASISRGINKNHADILHHNNKVSFIEEEIAKEFIKNPKKYEYIGTKPKNIYPKDFSY